ncbi:MAG: nucleotidyltransferase family protein [Acidimicrobiia bacterium]
MARPHPLLIEVAAGRAIDPAAVDLTVVEAAVEHRMSGLLLAAMGDAETADHGIRARLEAIDMAATVQRVRLMGVAASLHRKLEAADIDHFFFKGVVEAHRLFDEPNHRPFADVDLCIRPGESLSAATAAIAPDFPNVDLLDDLEAGGYISSVSFFEDGQPLDLHTDVVRVGPRARHPELWWGNTLALDLPGLGTVRALNREASFVVFVLHQARDRFRYLIGAAEYRLRLSEDLSFDAIRSLAEAEGLWDQVAVGMSAMSEDLKIPTPVSVPNTVRARQWQRLWKRDVRLAGPAGRYRYARRSVWLMPVMARGRMAASLFWIARSAFPPDAQLRRKHPHARGPYLWRVVSSRVSHMTGRRRQASRFS